MFARGDIVLIKIFPLHFLVLYVNNGDGKVWVSSLGTNSRYTWKVSPKDLIKVR